MKTLIHAAIILGLISNISAQGLSEIRDIFRKEDGHTVITKRIKDATEVKRKELLAMIVQLVKDDLAKPQVFNKSSDRVTTAAAHVFVATGAEQAMLDAFKENLDNTRPGELIEIVESLAACRGEEQTDIIERLARDRLPILGDTLISSEIEAEKYARNDLLGSFSRILMELASSANPTGMASAKKIRDEFAVLYPSANGKLVLAAIDAELAKATPRRSSSTLGQDVKETGRSPDDGLKEPTVILEKPEQLENQLPQTQVTKQTQTSGNVWTWIIGIVSVLLAGLVWLRGKKSHG
jgi:hypothetical protein